MKSNYIYIYIYIYKRTAPSVLRAAVEGLTGGRERRPGRRSHSLTHSFHLIPHLSPFPEEEGEPHRGPGAEAGQKKPTGQGSGSSESTGQ